MSKILIVEDEIVFISYLERFLKERGYQTVTTSSAEAAFKLMSVDKIDLVILDLKLAFGSMMSEDILKKMSTKFPHVKIIVCSADSQYLDQCREYQAHAYMHKPISVKELHSKIKELIG